MKLQVKWHHKMNGKNIFEEKECKWSEGLRRGEVRLKAQYF